MGGLWTAAAASGSIPPCRRRCLSPMPVSWDTGIVLISNDQSVGKTEAQTRQGGIGDPSATGWNRRSATGWRRVLDHRRPRTHRLEGYVSSLEQRGETPVVFCLREKARPLRRSPGGALHRAARHHLSLKKQPVVVADDIRAGDPNAQFAARLPLAEPPVARGFLVLDPHRRDP